jgi:hypothetical protein
MFDRGMREREREREKWRKGKREREKWQEGERITSFLSSNSSCVFLLQDPDVGEGH